MSKRYKLKCADAQQNRLNRTFSRIEFNLYNIYKKKKIHSRNVILSIKCCASAHFSLLNIVINL